MISGLVVHLAQDVALSRAARACIDKRTDVDVGDAIGHRLPLVLESADQAEAEATTEWLRELKGVLHVDVTFVHLDHVDVPQNAEQ